MADVIINPPAQVTIVAASGQQTQNTNAQTHLPQGTLVSGTITGRDASGNFTLKSLQGTFTLQSTTPLTYNSDVTIRIGANNAGNTNARIVSVNGEPFSEFSAPEPATSDSVSTSLLTQTAPDTANTAPTTNVRGVVVSAPPAAPEQTGPTLLPGSAVVVRVPQTASNVTQPEQPQSPQAETPAASVTGSATVAAQPQQTAQLAVPAQPPATPPAQPTPVSSATVSVAPAAAAPVETELAPAQTVTQSAQTLSSPEQQTQSPQTTVQLQTAPQAPVSNPSSQSPQAATLPPSPATTPQASPSTPVAALYNVYTKQASTAAPAPVAQNASASAPTPSASTAAQAATLPAQVVSANEDGTLNLQTSLGNVTVKTAPTPSFSSLSPGTSLLLEIITSTAAQAALDAAPASITELATSWQSLKDIAAQTSPEDSSASTPLLARLPQMGPSFLSESMAFISGLLQGDTRKLLGDDTVDQLQQNGRAGLLEKFSAEVATMSASFNAPEQKQVAAWQMLTLPFVFQEALQQARLYVKREAPKKDRAGNKAPGDTRFVVEVDLSDLGPLQMDGLVRKQEKTTAFDLIIRSHKPFLPEDQAGILSIYNDAAEVTGFKGALAFQVTRDFPVKPIEEMLGNDARSITV